MRPIGAAMLALALLTMGLFACASTPGTVAAPSTSATVSATAEPTLAPSTASSPPGPGPGNAAQVATVTVTRSGGIMGTRQEIKISPDGSWVMTDTRANRTDRGQLTAAQRQQLATLTSDPALVSEARVTPAPGDCADAFAYDITIGELPFHYEQCGDTSMRPATNAVLNLILDVTPM